ncbi:GAF domain-containing sensor histidine kinase [bacterium]|nr:GAF domain-containing sensor histidine kinase [bacterium]
MYRDRSKLTDFFQPGVMGPVADEFNARERAMLNRIAEELPSATSISGMMEFLNEVLGEGLPGDRLVLFLVREDRSSAYVHWSYEPVGDLTLREGFEVALPDKALSLAIQQNKPQIYGDVDRLPLPLPANHWLELLRQRGSRSCIISPLCVNNDCLGLLVQSSNKPYAYGYHEIILLSSISTRIAQLLLKLTLIDELTATNKAYQEILGFVSHELKNPLAAMVMESKLLVQGFLGELTDKQEQHINKIITKAQYLLSLIREYLDLSRLESGELTPRIHPDVNFAENVLSQALDMVSGQLEVNGANLELDVPEQPLIVQVDPDLMLVVMINLLGNAVKYGREGGTIRVTIKRTKTGFNVRVWNEGPGFPETEKPNLFRKFSRLNQPELRKQKGTGVGLYTVWQILRLHSGRVWAESEPGRWAEFGFAIPQPLPGAE